MKKTKKFLLYSLVDFDNDKIPSDTQYAGIEGPRIGIMGAMEEEVNLFKESMTLEGVVTVSDMDYYLGTISGKPVVIVQCGMGKVNAGICTQTLIREFHAVKVINTGVAGSLNSKIDIGDIVVSEDAVQHDYDVSPIGFKKGEIPYTGLYAFPADEYLQCVALKTISDTAPEVSAYSGRICSGDQFITLPTQKDAILKSFGGFCCDMESAAIAQVCHLNRTPYVILRAISDKPDGSEATDFNRFKEEAAHRSAKVVLKMLEELS